VAFPGWVDVPGFSVERNEGRRPGGQKFLTLLASTKRVIWHTTEGSSVDGAVSTLKANFSCPHFVIGNGRIVQMRPLWAEAATVRGDNSRAWQVECVGFSKQQLWLPDEGTRRPMVALLKFFLRELDVPFTRPLGWKDDLSDIEGTLATEGNSRRVSNRAPGFVGHVMHLEWPENTHWDQGAIRWTTLLDSAGQGDDDMTDAEKAQLAKALDLALNSQAALSGVDDFLDGTPPPDTAREARKHMYRALRRAAAQPVPEPPDSATGITRDEADARYSLIGHPHAASTTVL